MPEGLSPGGTMNSEVRLSSCSCGGATTRVTGLLRLKPPSPFLPSSGESPQLSSFPESCRNPGFAAAAIGEAMAPARSWEKEKGPCSEKKLETRDIGPGLNPIPPSPLENRDSIEPRGGTTIVGFAVAAASSTVFSPIPSFNLFFSFSFSRKFFQNQIQEKEKN